MGKFSILSLILVIFAGELLAQKPPSADERKAMNEIRKMMEDDFKQSLLLCATGMSYVTAKDDYKTKTNRLITECTDSEIKENLQEVNKISYTNLKILKIPLQKKFYRIFFSTKIKS